MKKMIAIACLFWLAGCTTLPLPQYSVSQNNTKKLQSLNTQGLQFVDFTQSAKYISACRLVGNIQPQGGESIANYVMNALNTELKKAAAYNNNATQVQGNVSQANFLSVSSLTQGEWNLTLELTSANGNKLKVSHQQKFETVYDPKSACDATADAFVLAVQGLINNVFTHNTFSTLL